MSVPPTAVKIQKNKKNHRNIQKSRRMGNGAPSPSCGTLFAEDDFREMEEQIQTGVTGYDTERKSGVWHLSAAFFRSADCVI